jgi:hypothetical protein
VHTLCAALKLYDSLRSLRTACVSLVLVKMFTQCLNRVHVQMLHTECPAVVETQAEKKWMVSEVAHIWDIRQETSCHNLRPEAQQRTTSTCSETCA